VSASRRRGTIVVDDIASLPGFEGRPWSSGRLVGLIDFAELEVSPGTRRGFVPNSAADALLRALGPLAQQLEQVLGRFEAERERESDALLVKQLERLFRGFGRRLPHYELFDVAESGATLDGRSSPTKGAGTDDTEPGIEGAAAADDPEEPLLSDSPTPSVPGGQAELFLPGPLHSVRILPREPRLELGQARQLRAVAQDVGGRKLGTNVGFSWNIVHGSELARLRAEDDEEDVVLGSHVRVEAGNIPGRIVVSVTAVQGEHDAEAEATILIDESLLGGARADLGIPQPHPVHAPAEAWRSRLIDERWEYNSGHPDYLTTVDDQKRKLRYVATLLAKELVLKRHQRPESAEMLEQMVEVLAWAEGRMPR
jgi:hypothetical protein